MAYGEKLFTFDFASADSKASQVAEVRGYQFASLQAPAFSTNFATTAVGIKLEGGYTGTTGQLAPVRAMGVYSAGSGLLEWSTVSGPGGISVEVPIWGMSFASPVLSTACTNGLLEILIIGYNDK